jgi:hypothetical protein
MHDLPAYLVDRRLALADTARPDRARRLANTPQASLLLSLC